MEEKEKAMKVFFVYLSEGMNALLPSTGTEQQRDSHENFVFSVGELRVYAEPAKEKAITTPKMTENRWVEKKGLVM